MPPDKSTDEETAKILNENLQNLIQERTTELSIANEELQKERNRIEKYLDIVEHRYKMEKLVTSISNRFININSFAVDDEINNSLKSICKFIDADRCFINLFAKDTLHVKKTYEWYQEGLTPIAYKYHEQSLEPYKWALGMLKDFGYIKVNSVANLPLEAKIEKDNWETSNIRSLLSIPLNFGNSLIGILGLTSERKEKIWIDEDVELLKLVANTIVNTLEHKRLTESIEKNERIYRDAIESAGAVPYCKNIVSNTYEFVGTGIQSLTGYSIEEFTPELFDSITQEFILLDEYSALSRSEISLEAKRKRCAFWWADLRIKTRDGKEKWLADSSVAIFDEHGIATKLLGILWDITKRKKMEEDLQRSEEIEKAIINATEDSLFLLDTNGIILLVNDACPKKLNKSKDEVVGKSIFVLIPTEIAERRWKYIDKVFKSGKPIHFQDDRAGIRFDHNIYPISDIDGKIKTVAIYSRDITESYRNEQERISYQKQLRSLASKLSTVEEQEKRRIARELHDRVGQNLALGKIKLEMLQKSTNSIPNNSINEIIEILDQTIQETRSLTFEISSPILFELGLESALEQLTEYMGQKYGISCSFKDDRKPKPMSEDIRIAIYQAIRELLTNVIKHAQATKVNVSIFRNDDCVYINVYDDGVGFDVEAYKSCKPSDRGFGLFSINERIEYLDGCVEIESNPEHGCCVTIVVPLTDEKCKKMDLYE